MNTNSKEKSNQDLIHLVKKTGKEFEEEIKSSINPSDIKSDLYRIISRLYEPYIKLLPKKGFIFKGLGFLEKPYRKRKNIRHPVIIQIKEGACGYSFCLNVYDNREKIIKSIEKTLNIELKQNKNKTRYYHQVYLISPDEYYSFRNFVKMTNCLKKRIKHSGYIFKLGKLLTKFEYKNSSNVNILRKKILKLMPDLNSKDIDRMLSLD